MLNIEEHNGTAVFGEAVDGTQHLRRDLGLRLLFEAAIRREQGTSADPPRQFATGAF